jgi:hypothetical protein
VGRSAGPAPAGAGRIGLGSGNSARCGTPKLVAPTEITCQEIANHGQTRPRSRCSVFGFEMTASGATFLVPVRLPLRAEVNSTRHALSSLLSKYDVRRKACVADSTRKGYAPLSILRPYRRV